MLKFGRNICFGWTPGPQPLAEDRRFLGSFRAKGHDVLAGVNGPNGWKGMAWEVLPPTWWWNPHNDVHVWTNKFHKGKNHLKQEKWLDPRVDCCKGGSKPVQAVLFIWRTRSERNRGFCLGPWSKATRIPTSNPWTLDLPRLCFWIWVCLKMGLSTPVFDGLWTCSPFKFSVLKIQSPPFMIHGKKKIRRRFPELLWTPLMKIQKKRASKAVRSTAKWVVNSHETNSTYLTYAILW